jgi:hypothetical protein
VNNLALIITALTGLLTGLGGMILGNKAQKRTEKIQHAASLLEGYDEMMQNQSREIERLSTRLVERDKELDLERTAHGETKKLLLQSQIEILNLKKEELLPKLPIE